MGDQRVANDGGGPGRRAFMRQVLNDLRTLERLIATGQIETGAHRIGAEQEVFLVDESWRPAALAMEMLEGLKDDARFTTEIGKFNMEVNLTPLELKGDCLSQLERQLNEVIDRLRKRARELDLDVALTGILPTLRQTDLTLENMTPKPRYFALNRAMCEMRGGAYELHIKGLDELLLRHETVMLEAANASFQVHFQVEADEFARMYNIAQLIAAAVLAAAVNSPLLFGRRLWNETRIALFQQSVDTRSSIDFLRERSPRVTFGNHWVRESVVELFQDDISQFRALVMADLESDSWAELERGEVPKLRALCLHNGTVYRWNRACYGITDGKPHLRIENRVLPSGPTIVDEVANAAFWFGLLREFGAKYGDVASLIPFEDAKMNFHNAARLGLGAQFAWFSAETFPAAKLISDHLIPLAEAGLKREGLAEADISRYLRIVDARVREGATGAQWATRSYVGMRGEGTISERLAALTAATVKRQSTGKPVAEWGPATLDEAGPLVNSFRRVEQYMSTDLFTVSDDESLDLVASLMQWKRIRHVPVEDNQHNLVGLISYRSLLKLMARGQLYEQKRQIAVSEFMTGDPICVAPEASTLEAIHLMRQHQISCLPVVRDRRLVGMITERELMIVAGELLEKELRDGGDERGDV